ncbi:MAG: hypothetical protein U9Q20_02135 [Campylobacterota bacterium]|nr:hypothetical protein [Campylobacterota bacterium]
MNLNFIGQIDEAKAGSRTDETTGIVTSFTHVTATFEATDDIKYIFNSIANFKDAYVFLYDCFELVQRLEKLIQEIIVNTYIQNNYGYETDDLIQQLPEIFDNLRLIKKTYREFNTPKHFEVVDDGYKDYKETIFNIVEKYSNFTNFEDYCNYSLLKDKLLN